MTDTNTVLSHTPQQIGGIKRSNAYKALIAKGLSEKKALKKCGVTKVVQAEVLTDAEAKIAVLVNAGFTQAEAEAFANEDAKAQFFTPTATKVKGKGKGKGKAQAVVVEDVPAKTVADSMVAQGGYVFARGRVYTNGAIIEAQARVLKGGSPEIVQTSGVGRTSAVVIFREESGDVAVQNLYTP